MPEITLKLDDPAKTVALLRDASAAAGSDGWNHTAGQHARWLAGQIEEQVRPAVAEPTEFGSLVRAGRGGSDRVLWHPTTFHGKHYWMSETGVVEVWSELTDVEVLRVGLGEPERDGFCTCHGNERALDCGISAHRNEARIYRDPMADEPEAERADVAPEETEDYKAGVSDTVFKIHGRLQNLLDGAITSERKNALEKAIQAVEELAP